MMDIFYIDITNNAVKIMDQESYIRDYDNDTVEYPDEIKKIDINSQNLIAADIDWLETKVIYTGSERWINNSQWLREIIYMLKIAADKFDSDKIDTDEED